MKRLCPVILSFCLLLTGCGGRDIRSEFSAMSERLGGASLSFTANVRAEYEDKTARFTLSYEEDGEGGSVTVLAPELIKGVTARIAQGSTSLEYATVVLDTGSLDSFGLSPMSSLPVLADALRHAHLDSHWEEDGITVLQLQPEDALKCRVWLDDGMCPVRAELISGERVTVYIEITDWNEG